MKAGANLLKFGAALEKEMEKIKADMPIGVDVFRVSDQPAVVDEAVSGFTRALFEAVVIVLAISFISLGLRAGLVVAIAIPLVLAITFLVMEIAGISLQRISLGALIIALGPAGRRRHDRGRNDGGAAGGRRRPAQGGDLCLHLDRLSRC